MSEDEAGAVSVTTVPPLAERVSGPERALTSSRGSSPIIIDGSDEYEGGGHEDDQSAPSTPSIAQERISARPSPSPDQGTKSNLISSPVVAPARNSENDCALQEKQRQNDESFTAELLEGELNALIDLGPPLTSGAKQPESTADSARSQSHLEDANSTSNPSLNATVETVTAATPASAPDMTYLAGLAAVLQAAQALQAAEDTPAGAGAQTQHRPQVDVPPPPPPPTEEATAATIAAQEAELSEFIVQLTAQLGKDGATGDIHALGGPGTLANAAVGGSAPIANPSHVPSSAPIYISDSSLSWESSDGEGVDSGIGIVDVDLENDLVPKAKKLKKLAAAQASKGKNNAKPKIVNEKKRIRNRVPVSKVHQCSLCGKIFGRPSDLARHGAIHTGIRPFACAHAGCGKTFIQRSALHVHLRTHTGERPHACEYPGCAATFGDSSSLARHRRTHAGTRPYACQVPGCGKGFTRRGALTAHMRGHDPEWENDPRVKYSFKYRKTSEEASGNEGEAGPSGAVDDEDEDEDDNALGMTLSTLIDRAGASLGLDMNARVGRGGGLQGQGGLNDPAMEARIAALSAEIAAAIVQAQMQAAGPLPDQDDEGDGDDEDEGEGPAKPDEERESEERDIDPDLDLDGDDDMDLRSAAQAVGSSVRAMPTSDPGSGWAPSNGVHASGVGSARPVTGTGPPMRKRGGAPSRSHVQQPHLRAASSRATSSGRDDEESDFPAPLRGLKRKR